jgi:hypothetical protein
MSIIGWIVFGLVVGLVAKFLMPGRDLVALPPPWRLLLDAKLRDRLAIDPARYRQLL